MRQSHFSSTLPPQNLNSINRVFPLLSPVHQPREDPSGHFKSAANQCFLEMDQSSLLTAIYVGLDLHFHRISRQSARRDFFARVGACRGICIFLHEGVIYKPPPRSNDQVAFNLDIANSICLVEIACGCSAMTLFFLVSVRVIRDHEPSLFLLNLRVQSLVCIHTIQPRVPSFPC